MRATFAWNLVVEVARFGASATLLAPRDDKASALWPEDGPGPVGSNIERVDAQNLSELHRAALDVAVARAADGPEGGIIVVGVPPEWLRQSGGRGLLRWALFFTSTDRHDLLETYALAKQVLLPDENARVGIAIHGAHGISEARQAFEHIADVAQRYLGRPLESYGLLVDDLHVYRAIVSRRPIGIEHPQSRAARALRDVAHLVLDDAEAATSA